MLLDKSLTELAKSLRAKEFSVEDLVKESLVNIKQTDSKLNSLITVVDEEKVIDQAKEADKNLNSQSPFLYGLPYVLKDAYVTKGIKTTAASKVLDNYIPQYDATVYKHLQKQGSILLGKANMDAWGHGGSTENTDYGPAHNPWNLDHSTGGSSGGCAAAVSARLSAFAIGEDTGGSIRNPSAWCNITGLKVTYGRVSRFGAISYASSFDTVGPMGKTAEDCAHILESIAGVDPFDATSSPKEVPSYSQLLNQDLKNISIALPVNLLEEGIDPEIKSALLQTAKDLQQLGVKINEVTMPIIDYGLGCYYLIAPSETSSNLARYDGIRFGNNRDQFTPETMRRIMIGTYALSAGYYDAYYRQAQKVRTMLINEYNKILADNQAILMPVNPTPPTKLGELISDPIANIMADVFTVTQNPAGVPSLAIPSGFTKNNLPIGTQLVGQLFSEDLLLALGHQYQQITEWHLKKPEVINQK